MQGFKAKRKEDLLALYVAKALNDMKCLPFYVACTRSYSEDYIREALQAVRNEAIQKIKNRRSTFFKYLLQINAKGIHKNTGRKSGN